MKTENSDSIMSEPSKENEVADQNDSLVDVKISDIVLTPFTCASLINEILKGLLYQKCQIPYPYSWLKSVVDKKRKQTENQETNKPINFTIANHFRVVSSTYDCLENIMKGIIKEFKENGDCIREVIFLFGATPQCPKEVFTISISSLANGHSDRNHANHLNKYQQRILRNIFLSQNWMDAIDASLMCTNTYVFLKKYEVDDPSYNCDNSENLFIPSKPLYFPVKLKHIRIKFNYTHSENLRCCSSLSVFEDVEERNKFLRDKQVDFSEPSETSLRWYQSKDLLKGFKDCFVNKVSACDLW